MSKVLRLALVDPDDTSRETIKNMLLGMDTIWLEAECSRYEFFADVIDQTNSDIGVIVMDKEIDKALRLVEELGRKSPECSVLIVSTTSEGDTILRAMRGGAVEFLTQPVQIQDVVNALHRVSEQKFGRGQNGAGGCTSIAVAGAMGGVGTTSTAVNLGCALAEDPNNSVVLIDLDMSLGDADVFLDTIPEYTLVDVVQNISRLDFALLKKSLTKHSSGLYLLPRPVQLQDTELVTVDGLQKVIGLLKATFSHLIFDLSKGFNGTDMAAIKAANHVLLVTQLDLPCLRNVVRLMTSFGVEEGIKDKLKVVVNRVGLDNHISLKKAQETVGCDVFWQLPNDYRLMVDVRNNGVPLVDQAPKAGITQSFRMLSDAISGNAYSGSGMVDTTQSNGWLRFLCKKKLASSR